MADRKEGRSRLWHEWLTAGLLLAVLLVAAATVAQRRTPVAAALLHLLPGTSLSDMLTPACTTRDLDDLMPDGQFTWSCLGAPCSSSSMAANGSGTPAAAQQQVPQLQLGRCMLRRFTPEAARKCLAGRPLIMIGDSLTRFQYLSLIYFLEYGRWPAPLWGSPGEPSPMIMREWGSWPRFLQGTTALFNGHEQCRCYRKNAVEGAEDRFFLKGDLSVTFYRWLGYPPVPLEGHWGFPPYSNATKCRPAECSAPPDWQLPFDNGLREIVAKLKPHTLVFNAGLWRRQLPDWPTAFYDSIFEAATAAVAPQGGRCIWKTNTFAKAGNLQVGREGDAAAVAAARRHGWLLLDAWAATRAAKMQLPNEPYIDEVHYLGFVYQELNQLLLNMVCPADG